MTKILSAIKDFFLNVWEKLKTKVMFNSTGKKRQFSALAITLGVVLAFT